MRYIYYSISLVFYVRYFSRIEQPWGCGTRIRTTTTSVPIKIYGVCTHLILSAINLRQDCQKERLTADKIAITRLNYVRDTFFYGALIMRRIAKFTSAVSVENRNLTRNAKSVHFLRTDQIQSPQTYQNLIIPPSSLVIGVTTMAVSIENIHTFISPIESKHTFRLRTPFRLHDKFDKRRGGNVG